MRLFLAFFLVPLADMALLIWAARQVGVLWTVAIVIGTALVGSALVKRQGLAVWAEARTRFASGSIPTRELAHGALLVAAGAFLLAPGIITDVAGLLLLVPAIREWVRVRVGRHYTRRGSDRVMRADVWR